MVGAGRHCLVNGLGTNLESQFPMKKALTPPPLPPAQQLRRAYFRNSDPEKLPLGGEDMACLKGYLRKMLVVDPDQRATSSELLSDPWVAGRPDSS